MPREEVFTVSLALFLPLWGQICTKSSLGQTWSTQSKMAVPMAREWHSEQCLEGESEEAISTLVKNVLF